MNANFVFGEKGQNLNTVLTEEQFATFKGLLTKPFVSALEHDHILENSVVFCIFDNTVLGFVNYEPRPEGIFIYYASARKSFEKEFIKTFKKSIAEILILRCLQKHKAKAVLFSSTTRKADKVIARNRGKTKVEFRDTTRFKPR